MNRTREDFCRLLLDDSPREALDPERLAARFVRYFDVPARPTMDADALPAETEPGSGRCRAGGTWT